MKQTLYATDKKGGIKVWSVDTEGAEIVVTHGRLGGKLQTKRTLAEGKNLGKVNETTPEQQAVLESISKYTKQMDKCYRPTVEEAEQVGNLLPMLAQNFLHHGHRISYPCYVSPKLDGVRCLADVDGTEVTLNSRGGKTYPCPEHIRAELVEISSNTGIKVFDGELYIHGMSLQNIVSSAKKPNKDTINLKFCVFDIPSKLRWEGRFSQLKSLKQHCKGSVEVVGAILVNSKESAEILLNRYIKDGYEGIMLRNCDGLYEYNHRSADLQKWKLMQDGEAKVLGVTLDKNGEGVLSCISTLGAEFSCKMKGTHEERLYEEQLKLVGKWITYNFQQLSDLGVPIFPVGLFVRDCDDEGKPLE